MSQRAGTTLIPPGPPAGAVYARVQQPVGNYPALNFLAATQWPRVSGFDPLRDDAFDVQRPAGPPLPNNPSPWKGMQPQTCRPQPHDFYNQYPGALPSGPLEPWNDPWPSSSKPAPGGPLMHDGAGGFAVPTPSLPPTPQGTGDMDSAQVADAMAYDANTNRGAGLMWLVALGLGYYMVTRRG